MQWPKCVKHVHKVTIKPIWSHLLGEPFKTTNRTRARVEPAVPHIPYCTALNSNTNHFLMVRFIVLGARERRQTIKCNYTHINTQSEEFKKQLKQLNHNPQPPATPFAKVAENHAIYYNFRSVRVSPQGRERGWGGESRSTFLRRRWRRRNFVAVNATTWRLYGQSLGSRRQHLAPAQLITKTDRPK